MENPRFPLGGESLKADDLGVVVDPVSARLKLLDGVEGPTTEELLDDPDDLSQEIETDGTDPDLNLSPDISTLDSMQLFLNEAGRYELLTAKQEVDLAKRIERGQAAERMLIGKKPRAKEDKKDKLAFKELAQKPLTGDELEALKVDGEEAKELMVNSNLRLVVSIAKGYPYPPMPLLDRIQDGVLGLVRAAEKFDHRKGFKFSTYATWWIRQAVARGLADKAKTIRTPVHIVEREQRVGRSIRALTGRLGRHPSLEEIAEEANMSLEIVKQLSEAAIVTTSLDQPVGGDEETSFGAMLTDTTAVDPYDEAKENFQKKALASLISGLSDREKKVIEMRYGLNEYPKSSLQEVGEAIGLTRERARQIENNALKKMAERAEWAGLIRGDDD